VRRGTPGLQACDRPEQESLTGSRAANDDHAISERDLHVLLAKHRAAGRRSNLQVLKGNSLAWYLNELDVRSWTSRWCSN
jgi:hypothetical protein